MTSRTRGRCKTGAAIFAALLLAACSSESEKAKTAADEVPNVPGTATVYVFNTGKPTFTIGQNTVYDYQRAIVTVSESRYAIVLIYGGRHVFTCAGMPGVAPVVFDAYPGQTYYFQTYQGSGGTQQICSFLPPDSGQRLLAKMQNR